MQLTGTERFCLAAIAGASLLFLVAERWRPYNAGQKVFRTGFFTDLIWYNFAQSWALGVIIGRLIKAIDASTGLSRLQIVSSWPPAAQVLLFLVTHDLYIYAFHRLQHRSPFLWRFHEAHHSVPEVDWLSGVRSHPVEILVNQSVEFAPILLLGAAPDVPVIKGALSAIWGMFIHANLDVRLGSLRYLFNGPEMHRWHHAISTEAMGHNFSTKLAVWDWLSARRTSRNPPLRRPSVTASRETRSRKADSSTGIRGRWHMPFAAPEARPWLYLILSSLLQVGWLVSLRQTQGFTRPVPIVFYALFGLSSTICLAKALQGIPMSTAYAVWTGISMCGSALVDMLVFREVVPGRLLCMLVILAGTTGLRMTALR